MERRLHPDFIASNESISTNALSEKRIQAQFDPTPHSLKKEIPGTINHHDDEFTVETKLRMARLSQKVTLIEKRLDKFIQEAHTDISKMASRLNEKVMQDTKVEALIERHNQVLLSFEKRMSQLAKYLEEKDHHIMLLQSQLEESKKELYRLKRI